MKYRRYPAAVLLLLVFISFVVQAQQKSPLKPVKVNGKWGYAGKNGKVVIQPQYDQALPFKDGLAKVGVRDSRVADEKNDLAFMWGLIDEAGRVVLKPEYHYVRDFADGLAAVGQSQFTNLPKHRGFDSDDLRWGFIDRTGTLVVPVMYSRIGDFSEGLAPISVDDEDRGLCRRHGKFGYIDKTGVVVIKPEYGLATQFKDGKARVGRGLIEYVGRCLCCNPEFRGEWGYIDKNGNFTADK
jgi:hypothetical protein